jgi:hypothetical protein
LKQAMTISFHILSNSSFINNPTIRRYIADAAKVWLNEPHLVILHH